MLTLLAHMVYQLRAKAKAPAIRMPVDFSHSGQCAKAACTGCVKSQISNGMKFAQPLEALVLSRKSPMATCHEQYKSPPVLVQALQAGCSAGFTSGDAHAT
jgi:hypothetical protein